MKTNNIITLTAFSFWLNMSLYAQFNTIGYISNKHIKTVYSSKSCEALTDNNNKTDSNLIINSKSFNLSYKDVNSMGDNHDLTSIVSLPLKKINISSGFGMRMHPIYHKRILHNGIDLSAKFENVYSMFPGTVIRVGEDDRSGRFVVIKTGDYSISYCHLSKQFVKENDFVTAGWNIALSGNTGASTGPHLHLTMKKDGKVFDPTILLKYIMSPKSDVSQN